MQLPLSILLFQEGLSVNRIQQKKALTPYVLIAPALLFLLLVYGYPLFLTFRYSLQDVSLIGGIGEFNQFANYRKMLADEAFYGTLSLTARWTILTVTLKLGCGFILALLLNQDLYLSKVLKFMVLIPWAIPQVVVAIVWSWILDGHYGYLNYYLQFFGLTSETIRWLSDPTLAFISTAVVDAWIGIPLITMMFLAGLTAIPESTYEAARMDGARSVQRFLHIALPAMRKVIVIALTLTTIWTFNAFNIIFVLTGGGPMGETETMMIRIYREAFGKYNLGMSSAMSVAVFVILIVLCLFYWKQLQAKED